MYRDRTLPSADRARDLLSRMTLEEKIDQMSFFQKMEELYDDIKAGKVLPCRCGSWGDLNNTDREDPVNVIQDYFVNKTRLGIPALIGFEALHGFFYDKATVFPQNAGLGGSFNKELISEMADMIGKEIRAAGIRQVYAPVLDIPRDPRWGRSQEAYGEDPYLVGEMGAAYIKGVQASGVAATAKHYLAYGATENGLNCTPAHVGEREIREVMLEPFKKAVDAGVHSLMPAYNEIDGVSCHASVKYLRDILRGEIGFEGTTIADWGGVEHLNTLHCTASDSLEAGKQALAAGLDIEEPQPFGYGDKFLDAAKRGEIDIRLIDEAVFRILKMKFDIGLFEEPYADPERQKDFHTHEAVEIARRLDEESILLLKNDGILPLDEHKIGKVAVIGNNAKNSFIGDYIGRTKNCISFYDGIVNRLGADRVIYAKGCEHIAATDEMIAEAVSAAKAADIVLLALGDSSPSGGGAAGGDFIDGQYTSGESYDASDLGLTPSQRRLFEAVIALSKPTVLVFYAGRPCAIKDAADRVNGFMLSWGGGEQNGTAFANLIFGDISPSAKLSMSLPVSVGTLPCYYNYKVSGRGIYKNPGTPEAPGRDYVMSTPAAWLPFGYGLSYTNVAYSDLSAQPQPDGTVKVCVTVENTGRYAINESVLLFVRMMYCPITPFIKKLRKFTKVELQPGDRRTVEFDLHDEDFTYIDHNMNVAVNHGLHKIYIDKLETSFER